LTYNHEDAVAAFLRKAQANDPERFASVASRYPVMTRRQMEQIHAREKPFGLIVNGDSGLE
jgi:hypothetical protein